MLLRRHTTLSRSRFAPDLYPVSLLFMHMTAKRTVASTSCACAICTLRPARAKNCVVIMPMNTTELSSRHELHSMLQGGMPGAERLGRSQDLMGLLQKQREAGRIWAAICAAPAVVLEAQGWLEDKKATCHPAFVEKLADQR